jgi:hypothetical protein
VLLLGYFFFVANKNKNKAAVQNLCLALLLMMIGTEHLTLSSDSET